MKTKVPWNSEGFNNIKDIDLSKYTINILFHFTFNDLCKSFRSWLAHKTIPFIGIGCSPISFWLSPSHRETISTYTTLAMDVTNDSWENRFLNISRKEKYLLKRVFVSGFFVLLLCLKMLIFVIFYVNPLSARMFTIFGHSLLEDRVLHKEKNN